MRFWKFHRFLQKSALFFVRFWTKIIVPKHPPYSLYFVAYFCPTYALYSQQYCCYQVTERVQYNTGNLTKRGCFLGQFLSPGDIFVHFCPRGHFGQFLEKRAIFENFWKKGQFLSISGNRGAFFTITDPRTKGNTIKSTMPYGVNAVWSATPGGSFVPQVRLARKRTFFQKLTKITYFSLYP